MEDEAYFHKRAAQCRRLAQGIINANDPAVAALIKRAEEFEALAEEYAQPNRDGKSQTGG